VIDADCGLRLAVLLLLGVVAPAGDMTAREADGGRTVADCGLLLLLVVILVGPISLRGISSDLALALADLGRSPASPAARRAAAAAGLWAAVGAPEGVLAELFAEL
jgi:hypothetical protein